MLVIHHNDLDGRCAAAIVVLKYQGKIKESVQCAEVDYKDADGFDVTRIQRNETVYIVDFSFKPEKMKEITEVTKAIYWIDHHKTAQRYEYTFEGLRDFSDKGAAGCELTWKFVMGNAPMPRPVALIGDYDAWRLKEAPESINFYEGLKLYSVNPHNQEFWVKLFSDETLMKTITEKGASGIQYRNQYVRHINGHYGYETEIGGHKAWACNIYAFGSAGLGDRFKNYPVSISYIYDGHNYTVSLYSETVDVGEIAKKHGGGGHKGAAGFVTNVLPFVPSSRG